MELDALLERFRQAAERPRAQLDGYLARGEKVIGCLPYYAPEELIYAAGMLPFGVWGAAGTIRNAKEYCASFYCTVAQMSLELCLTGALDGLSGILTGCLCDTLRPLSQNLKAARPNFPILFLAHPQNRRLPCGEAYLKSEYERLIKELEGISGRCVSEEDLREAIVLCNENRRVRRAFVALAGRHADRISPRQRCAVLKSAYFMDKKEHTAWLSELNELLAQRPDCVWRGPKVVVSGVLNDSPRLLELLGQYGYAVAADDVAHESRGIRQDADEKGNPLDALVRQFAAQDQDPLLYDPDINTRPGHMVRLCRESGAQGVVILMMQFCDPEEIEYPSLKKGLDEAGIPSVVIGVDQQMTDFAQAATALQTFRELLTAR